MREHDETTPSIQTSNLPGDNRLFANTSPQRVSLCAKVLGRSVIPREILLPRLDEHLVTPKTLQNSRTGKAPEVPDAETNRRLIFATTNRRGK